MKDKTYCQLLNILKTAPQGRNMVAGKVLDLRSVTETSPYRNPGSKATNMQFRGKWFLLEHGSDTEWIEELQLRGMGISNTNA